MRGWACSINCSIVVPDRGKPTTKIGRSGDTPQTLSGRKRPRSPGGGGDVAAWPTSGVIGGCARHTCRVTPTSRVTEPRRVTESSRGAEPSRAPQLSRAPRRAAARFASLVAVVTLLAVGFGVGGVPESDAIATAVADWGVAAPAAAVAATAVLLLALVPRTLLAAAAGLLFGPAAGAAYLIAGATIGAATAFGLGRWLGRDFVAAQALVRRADRWIARGGVLGVLALRLLPIAPFGLVSYALG
ncbi:MAG: hypothetical protein GEU94_16625, partial [Micromonosporaceae bacterium]|nr:hypothetical protein [Micromonosporaceae bacterium]